MNEDSEPVVLNEESVLKKEWEEIEMVVEYEKVCVRESGVAIASLFL